MNHQPPFCLGQKVKCVRYPTTKDLILTYDVDLGEEVIINGRCFRNGVWWLRFEGKNCRHFYLADRFQAIK